MAADRVVGYTAVFSVAHNAPPLKMLRLKWKYT